jgi:hypothetical protein
MTVTELAAAAGVNQRYLREWLSHQAASNYLSYDPATQNFALPPEQKMVLCSGRLSCWQAVLFGEAQSVDGERAYQKGPRGCLGGADRGFPGKKDHLTSRDARCR